MAGDHTLQMNPYLNFKGDCEAAFKFYERCLAGQLGTLFRYGGTPLADQVPADWSDKIMHGSVRVGDQVIMGGDVAPDLYEEPQGFAMSLHIKRTTDAERIFHELASGGRVMMSLEKTFWTAGFGMVVDRFGIPWLINCEDSKT
ncbi:MAG TPA: glyoxalase/bleomycin resistance/extradiol dioxygenase family protein [Gemmatimonadaceae bacterium]|nr:glyoxalase/bleomycin resistance/extradiol dioxygenase family protein [Gemmatimonadaceae bacterium]